MAKNRLRTLTAMRQSLTRQSRKQEGQIFKKLDDSENASKPLMHALSLTSRRISLPRKHQSDLTRKELTHKCQLIRDSEKCHEIRYTSIKDADNAEISA